MRIVLLRPRTHLKDLGIVSVQYPINLGYLSAFLKQRGVEVKVYDLEVMTLSDARLIESISAFKPDLIGLSSMTPTIIEAHRIARLCKDRGMTSPVVIGGVHVSAIPKETLLEFPSFDLVVVGEGEQTLLETLQKVSRGESLRGIAGLVVKEGSNISFGPKRDLIAKMDELPYPDREMVPIDLYKSSHVSRGFSRRYLRIAEIMIARGCPYFCTFCASQVNFGRKVRFRSIDNIRGEIELLVKKHDINHFSILDDTFTLKRELTESLCNIFKELGVTWDCFSRVDRIDDKMARMMVKSGCRKISFGIESGSKRILKLIRKDIMPEQVEKAFKICKKAGMKYVEGTFILGGDVSETFEDIEETKRLIYRIRPDILGLFTIVPYPGTYLNVVMKKKGYLKKENWEEFVLYGGSPSWRTDNFTLDELEGIQKKILRRYYLSPRTVFNTFRKLGSVREFMYLVIGGFSFIKSTLSSSGDPKRVGS